MGDNVKVYASEKYVDEKILENKITGTPGQFVVIGDDGNATTKTVPNAEEVAF